jgi:hypothetical protein
MATKLEVQFDETETDFEAVVQGDQYEGDRTAADYADAEPTNDEAYD